MQDAHLGHVLVSRLSSGKFVFVSVWNRDVGGSTQVFIVLTYILLLRCYRLYDSNQLDRDLTLSRNGGFV
jgi:hypothetical protein